MNTVSEKTKDHAFIADIRERLSRGKISINMARKEMELKPLPYPECDKKTEDSIYKNTSMFKGLIASARTER